MNDQPERLGCLIQILVALPTGMIGLVGGYLLLMYLLIKKVF